MGRRAKHNQGLPPRMRRRRKNGQDRYSYDKGWQVKDGKRVRDEEFLGTDYFKAYQRYCELEADKKYTPNGLVTLKDAVDRFVVEFIPQKARSTQREYLRQKEALLKFFGPTTTFDQIKTLHVQQMLDTFRHIPTEANRRRVLFSNIWNFAKRKGLTDLPNPCDAAEGHEETGRDAYIEDDLYKRVWDAADIPTRELMDGCYLTGQRVGDVLNMAFTDIADGVLNVRQSKTKTKVRIEIKGQFKQLIERIQRRMATLPLQSFAIFCNESGAAWSYNTLNKRFIKARGAAGVAKENFQLRDLRAKAATDTDEATGSSRKAQDQLGHSSITMTEHYIKNRRGKKVSPTK